MEALEKSHQDNEQRYRAMCDELKCLRELVKNSEHPRYHICGEKNMNVREALAKALQETMRESGVPEELIPQVGEFPESNLLKLFKAFLYLNGRTSDPEERS